MNYWIPIIVGIFTIIGGIGAYTVTVYRLGQFTAALNENTRMTIETYNTVKNLDKRVGLLESIKADKDDLRQIETEVIKLRTQHEHNHKGA